MGPKNINCPIARTCRHPLDFEVSIQQNVLKPKITMHRFVIDDEWISDEDDQPLIIPGNVAAEKARRTELMEGTSSMYMGESIQASCGQIVISDLTTDNNNELQEGSVLAARAQLVAQLEMRDDLNLVFGTFLVCVLIIVIAYNIAFKYF